MRVFSEEARHSRFRLVIEIFAGLFVLLIGAAILFPFFVQGSGRNGTACLSNMKQLATGIAIYQSDNEDKLPPYFTFDGKDKAAQFMAVTANYTKNPAIYHCIKDRGPSAEWPEGLDGKMSYVHCLALKGFIPNFSKGGRVLKAVLDETSSAKIAYMRDPLRGYGPMNDSSTIGFLGPHPGFVVSYLDTHVKRRYPIDINTEL